MTVPSSDPKPKDAVEVEKPAVKAPSSVATGFVRYILGFGVWVALGLAPFLGAGARIPGFAPLLDLYPQSLRSWLIPLSGFLMGTIALVVEYAAGQRLVLKRARAWFKRSIIVLLSTFFILVMVYGLLITRIPLGDGSRHVAVVTGWSLPTPIPEGCECEATMTNEQCVEEITVSPVNIGACFGRGRVELARRALSLLYLVLTGSFAVSVGVVLLLKRDRDRKARTKRRVAKQG